MSELSRVPMSGVGLSSHIAKENLGLFGSCEILESVCFGAIFYIYTFVIF